MRLTTLAFVGSRASPRNTILLSFLSSLFPLVVGYRALGDGCFVFRWDKKKLVSNRAFSLLQAVTGQSIPQDEVKRWDEWWDKNKAGFTALTSSR